jgi:hypothetical protein
VLIFQVREPALNPVQGIARIFRRIKQLLRRHGKTPLLMDGYSAIPPLFNMEMMFVS